MNPRLKLFGLLAVLIFTLVAVAYAAIPSNFQVQQNQVVDKSTRALLMEEGSYTTFGNGSLTFSGSGTSTLNLSGTGSTSVPCLALTLTCTSSGCLVSSTTAAGTLPLPANVPFTMRVNNVNAVYVTGGSANNVGYAYPALSRPDFASRGRPS